MIKKILRTRFAFICFRKLNKIKYLRIFFRENSKSKRVFLKNIQSYKVNHNKKFDNVLVQEVDHHRFTLKIGVVVKAFFEKKHVNVFSYSPNFNKRLGWIDKYEKGYFFIFQNFTSRVYRQMGYIKLFSLDDSYYKKKEVLNIFNSKYKNIKTINDLLNFEIEGIVIGDLIYDTYLRYFEKHTIKNIYDENLKDLIYFTIDNYFLIKHYIEKYCFKSLITTYASYTCHGLAVRICLEKKIPVYSVGDDGYMVKEITKEYPYSINHYWNYKFEKLDLDISDKINKQLTKRFTGHIDTALSYVKFSTFGTSSQNINYFGNKKKRNVVVYVHDLYDSPHWIKKFLYNDYFEFITELCEQIKEDKQTRYYFKLHPNAIKGSNEIIIEFLENLNLNSVTILPIEVKNNDIIVFNPDLVVTVNGTIGMEMAYFHIPVVALEDNLYMNFSFVHSCSTLKEFYSIVKGDITPTINFDKDEILSFYYQAYIKDLLIFDKELLPFLSSNGYENLDDFLDECNYAKELLFNDSLVNKINSVLH
jgi:hypothetical protein